MANKYTTLADLFTAIANSIRAKKNSTDVIVADNFPTEIDNLKVGGFDYNNTDITSIPDYAFYGCEDLTSVDCCNLTSVGTSAFENCKNLKSVVLCEGVESIGENAFKGCSEDLIIYCMFENIPETWNENWNPDNCDVVCATPVETWDISATSNDNVTAKLYNDLSNDGMYLLIISGTGEIKSYSALSIPWRSDTYRKYIKTAIIRYGITNIMKYMFSSCSALSDIFISKGIVSISESAFMTTSITNFIIPKGVTHINDGAFSECSNLSNIVIPDRVTNIGIIDDRESTPTNGAFGDCKKLRSIIIPDSVKIIGTRTFQGATTLSSVTIGNGVTRIGYQAFHRCYSLTSIIYTGTISQWNAISFGTSWNHSTGNYTIHCTDGDIAKDGTITYHNT